MLAHHLLQRLERIDPVKLYGRVLRAVGLTIEGTGPASSIGQLCRIVPAHHPEPIEAEVVGFRDGRVLLMPLGDVRGIGPGSHVIYDAQMPMVPVGPELLGRVLDGLGRPLDGREPIPASAAYPLYHDPPNPLERERIACPLDVGIRAINALLTCGRGQKVGIFAGSGVGKSVLLGMMCRQTEADVTVIALIGERGREVKEFIEKELGPTGRQRAVVVAATSDQPPLVRLRGAFLATAIAEYFRDQGRHVLLLMDSLTRVAHAQREVGLAVGEPPTSKGYPPSVFALLPKILERVAPTPQGTMTGLYTVLVEGDDLADPIADFVRAVLDGHIVLTRELAARGHFPAIDVLKSISRVMPDIVSRDHLAHARFLLELLAVYQNAEDLINLGAYRPGSNARLDLAVSMIETIQQFLRQDVREQAPLADSVRALEAIVYQARERIA
ncbi:MAG: FliI/YscN family ATPase [Nitrospirae bacterium]|nr:MAG: FliI/YscN family ATPase [Nitrospirota bacterium]